VCGEALKAASLTLCNIEAVAVTYAPGLIGALLVGVNFAKGVALALGKPLIPVHHIRAHIAGAYITYPDLQPPFTALIVSGGHTAIVRVRGYTDFETVGTTLDDAAGETFDKAARAMGLPYPGGVHIGNLAKNGDNAVETAVSTYKLPFPKTENKYDFSFSGLKTAVINLIHNASQSGKELDSASLAASFQHTVCEILVSKTIAACREFNGHGESKICLCGGVAANTYLREMLTMRVESELSGRVYFPHLQYCGDNAAMVGSQGYYEYKAGNVGDSSLNACATVKL
jgi:N6-L-threonylcarbamoyladenine synthase